MDESLKFVARRLAGEHGGTVQGVQDLPQDRLQDLRSLSGVRHSRTHGHKPAPCRPASRNADTVLTGHRAV
jgi:hypothetical protein